MMPPLEVAGWLATLFVGLTMGLLGGGGSILTVPVLVYFFGLQATTATGDSLFIVGATALVGAWFAARRGEVDLRRALAFALPSMAAVFAVRRWAVPSIPAEVVGISKDRFLILLFAGLMVTAAVHMLRSREPTPGENRTTPALLPFLGLGVGGLAGLVGAGGGFMIVPALALFAGLRMKEAVATSLAVIAAQSLVGFLGELGRPAALDWTLLLGVTGVSLVGLAVGRSLAGRVESHRLRPTFAWFVLAMALVLVAKETLHPS